MACGQINKEVFNGNILQYRQLMAQYLRGLRIFMQFYESSILGRLLMTNRIQNILNYFNEVCDSSMLSGKRPRSKPLFLTLSPSPQLIMRLIHMDSSLSREPKA